MDFLEFLFLPAGPVIKHLLAYLNWFWLFGAPAFPSHLTTPAKVLPDAQVVEHPSDDLVNDLGDGLGFVIEGGWRRMGGGGGRRPGGWEA